METDEAHIARLLELYARRIDDADSAGFAELFRTGTWLGRTGYDEALAWLLESVITYDGHTLTRHVVSNLCIVVTGNRASAASEVAVHETPPGKGRLLVTTNSYDTFLRGEKGWSFATPCPHQARCSEWLIPSATLTTSMPDALRGRHLREAPDGGRRSLSRAPR